MNLRQIIGIVIFLIFYGISITIVSYNIGYEKAKAEQQATINLDKKTLENHVQKIDTIRAESANDANNRLRQNLRSN